MHGKQLYEYAVIRIVPRVEREEFINVGVILYCKDLKFLKAVYHINEEKLKMLCQELDCQEVKEHLESFRRIAEGDSSAGPIAHLDLPSRFRWLTATRSTIVQTSKVHPGFCSDPNQLIDQLMQQLVL